MKQPEQSGKDSNKGDVALALFEKIQINSEEIGKMRMEPFSVESAERVRALYRFNMELYRQLKDVLEKK